MGAITKVDFAQCPNCEDMLYPMAVYGCGHTVCAGCGHSDIYCQICYWQRDPSTASGFVIPTDALLNTLNQVEEWCPCCDWYGGCLDGICPSKTEVRT